jgi:hypothetical protein
MPDNFGRFTSSEVTKKLKNFCFPEITEQDEIDLYLKWHKCPKCRNQYCITILKECPICEKEEINHVR